MAAQASASDGSLRSRSDCGRTLASRPSAAAGFEASCLLRARERVRVGGGNEVAMQGGLSRAARAEQRAESREQRAESREPSRAESSRAEPRAASLDVRRVHRRLALGAQVGRRRRLEELDADRVDAVALVVLRQLLTLAVARAQGQKASSASAQWGERAAPRASAGGRQGSARGGRYNRWPKWPLQRAHTISTRRSPCEKSACALTEPT